MAVVRVGHHPRRIEMQDVDGPLPVVGNVAYPVGDHARPLIGLAGVEVPPAHHAALQLRHAAHLRPHSKAAECSPAHRHLRRAAQALAPFLASPDVVGMEPHAAVAQPGIGDADVDERPCPAGAQTFQKLPAVALPVDEGDDLDAGVLGQVVLAADVAAVQNLLPGRRIRSTTHSLIFEQVFA
jgi:hypothetical protein